MWICYLLPFLIVGHQCEFKLHSFSMSMLWLQAMNQFVLIFANAIVKATTYAYATVTAKLKSKFSFAFIICHIKNSPQCKATNEKKNVGAGTRSHSSLWVLGGPPDNNRLCHRLSCLLTVCTLAFLLQLLMQHQVVAHLLSTTILGM